MITSAIYRLQGSQPIIGHNRAILILHAPSHSLEGSLTGDNDRTLISNTISNTDVGPILPRPYDPDFSTTEYRYAVGSSPDATGVVNWAALATCVILVPSGIISIS